MLAYSVRTKQINKRQNCTVDRIGLDDNAARALQGLRVVFHADCRPGRVNDKLLVEDADILRHWGHGHTVRHQS